MELNELEVQVPMDEKEKVIAVGLIVSEAYPDFEKINDTTQNLVLFKCKGDGAFIVRCMSSGAVGVVNVTGSQQEPE